jgi:hypothetical protein
VPNNTPSASRKTRPSILGDVSALSPEAIEALPAEEHIAFSARLLAAWGRSPRLGESKSTSGTPLSQD